MGYFRRLSFSDEGEYFGNQNGQYFVSRNFKAMKSTNPGVRRRKGMHFLFFLPMFSFAQERQRSGLSF